jgi:hypothetical protein
VLCWNCNLGKSINYGICPHKEIKRKLESRYDKRHNPQFDRRLTIVWPTDDELIRECNETSITDVIRRLGVTFGALSGRLKRRNKYHLVQKKTGGNCFGETNPSSKLTAMLVSEIRIKHREGISRKDLAVQYRVCKGTIDKIVTYRIWVDNDEPQERDTKKI